MLKPSLARGELHCIGATTLNEYRNYIEKDTALARRFQQLYVDEPSLDSTVSILRGLKEKYEVHHGISISDKALISATKLSSRYITESFLPDKAIDLIDEAASKKRIELVSKPECATGVGLLVWGSKNASSSKNQKIRIREAQVFKRVMNSMKTWFAELF